MKAIFFQRLRTAIKASGLKQKEISLKTGISQVTLSRYCSGLQMPTRSTINLLARELGLSTDWFYRVEAVLKDEHMEGKENTNNDKASCSNAEELWKQRALNAESRASNAEERLTQIENILRELFEFAKKENNID